MTVRTHRVPCTCGAMLVIRVTIRPGQLAKAVIQDHRHEGEK